MRLLITGASGLLGLTAALEACSDYEVTGVINRHPVKHPELRVIRADFNRMEEVDKVFEEVQPEAVIHCAAMADVDQCERDPRGAQRLNAELPGDIAYAAKRCQARLIHISTDAVFDGLKGDYREEDSPSPVNVYGRTKLAGERIVRAVYPEAAIARVNLFGWSPSGNRSLAEFFFHNLKDGRPVNGYRNVFFNPLLVNDLARILFELLARDVRGVIHVGGRDQLSKYEFGLRIADLFHFDRTLITPVDIEETNSYTARGRNLTMNVDKLIHILDAPLPDLSTALEDLSTLYRQGYPQKIQQMVDYQNGGE